MYVNQYMWSKQASDRLYKHCRWWWTICYQVNEAREESMSIWRLQSYNHSSCVLVYMRLSLVKHEAVFHGKEI